MVSHQHLFMYLLAAKSLLRFGGRLAVAVHDDGTLDAGDRRTLQRHLPGARIIDAARADREVHRRLAGHPACQAYRARRRTGKQLFDFTLLARAPRIISMDSDVLFFRQPRQMFHWMEGGSPELLAFYEPTPGTQRDLLQQLELQDCFRPMGLAIFCFHADLLDLDLLERVLPAIRAHDWWTTQNLYPVLVHHAAGRRPLALLDPADYQDPSRFADSGPVARHYWTSRGVGLTYLRDMVRSG